MSKEKFLKVFEMALTSEDITEITVMVSEPMRNKNMTFGREKFREMYDYYKNNYDDKMRLKSCPIIYIREIDFTINDN